MAFSNVVLQFSSQNDTATTRPHGRAPIRVDGIHAKYALGRSAVRRRRHGQRFIPRPRPHWRTAHLSPPRKTTSHRACAHARTGILLLCVPCKSSSRPPFATTDIIRVSDLSSFRPTSSTSVAWLSAVICICILCIHSFFSAPRPTLHSECYTYRRVTLRRAHSLRTVVSAGVIVASVSLVCVFFFFRVFVSITKYIYSASSENSAKTFYVGRTRLS